MAHVFYGRIYSLGECYRLLQEGIRTVPLLMAARMKGFLHRGCAERIMLAVTEVNGCEVCSHAHARIALAQGMDAEEIGALLAGDTGAIPAGEAPAITFAQHYADARGRPDVAAWRRLLATEGSARAHGILAAVRLMMIGNAFGIAWGAFARRLAGKPVEKSSPAYEVAMLVVLVVFVPAAGLHALIAVLAGRPLVSTHRPGRSPGEQPVRNRQAGSR